MKGKELLKQFLKEKDSDENKRIIKYSTLFKYFQGEEKLRVQEMMEWAYKKGLHTWDKKDFEEVFGDKLFV